MITAAKLGTRCSYCQDAYGGSRIDGVWVWHPKAMKQAVVTITSQRFKANRSYCESCRSTVSNWPTGEIYPLFAQVMDAQNG
jgi:hypothetical protein